MLSSGDFAPGAPILAGHATRAASLLGASGVVEDEEARGGTVGDPGRHAVLVKGLGGPGRIGPAMRHAFGRGPRHRRCHGVTVRAWQVGEQPREGARHTRPAGLAAKERCAGGQIGGECWQGIGTGFGDNRGVQKDNENCTLSTRGKC
jgi:hypothetical protein